MKSLSTDEIRRLFLDYFVAAGHTEVASGALVPANDPSLLFTNAGMVPFKDVFTGKETRAYSRATTAQKVVRAGGKHNDLENVGFTPRHHTFFEMLGNFSFGDYFKKDAIQFAWTFITERLELPLDRLCVTVFKGEDGVPADDEAADLWASVGVPRDRIFRLGKADNYWQMGDTGPQGPCSEIHFFTADDTDDMFAPGRVENSEGWVEIWNLVFMQFVRHTVGGPLESLPKPSVDTGAGLERLAMVMQKQTSTYETDGFRDIIAHIAKLAGKTYGASEAPDDVSMRVVADHARATTFLVADGVQPSNEKRGYVLRRIMRRAIRHGDRLGFDDLFLHKVCNFVIEQMAHAYPEIERARALISKVAQNEEAGFRRTLQRGLKLLNDRMADDSDRALAPDFVGRLYDTYGFPIDLTRVIANENGFSVDEDAARQFIDGVQAASGGQVTGPDTTTEKLWFDLRDEFGATEFIGYTKDKGRGVVRALVVKGQRVDAVTSSDGEVRVLLDVTPFYGESGGQVGDSGDLSLKDGRFEVRTTQKPVGELIVHHGVVVEGQLAVGDSVYAQVDAHLRNQTKKNHSATHLLHLALREVLGDHVQQKGSLVAPDRLRFDYSHFEPLKATEIEAIEARVNEMVLDNQPTVAAERSMEEAQAEGATMLFGEKYGDRVRTVRVGSDSLELCGGTHVDRAGDIGLVKVVSDQAIASGIRRVEVVTGMHALRYLRAQETLVRQAAAALKAKPEEIADRIDKLQRRTKELERELERASAQAAMGGHQADPMADVEDIEGVRVLVKRADATPKKALRPLADQLRDKLGSGVVILAAADGGRASLLVAATKDVAGKKVHAGNVVKAATAAMAGSGGGKPDFAQGGGEAAQLDKALDAARATIAGATA
ncbi:MAG: alanine--tRNA ligase [Myxococcota bacterium]